VSVYSFIILTVITFFSRIHVGVMHLQGHMVVLLGASHFLEKSLIDDAELKPLHKNVLDILLAAR
jgi:hypothetical protein